MSRVLVPVLVVAALAAVYGLAAFGRPVAVGPAKQVSSVRSAPVSSVVRACPSPGVPRSGANVAFVAASTGSASGQAQLSRLGSPGGAPLARLTQPGQLSLARVKAASPVHHASTPAPRHTSTPAAHPTGTPAAHHSASPSPAPGTSQPVATVPAAGGVVVQAAGSLARGLEAEQTTPLGITTAQCQSPGTDFWFAGPGQHTAARIQLYLMNVSGQPADANVEAATDAGPLQGSTDTGIAVAPHSMVVQSLAGMLHGSRVISLHVRTSVGQVVAAVQEITPAGGTGAWLPVAQAPATQVILPGLPATAGSRQLFVAVPGAKDAHIKLTAVSSRGSFEPTGAGGLDIPGSSAQEITLPSMGGIPAAVKISANVPVTATAMLTGGPAGAPGVFTAATPAIQEQGVIADSLSGSGQTSELVLSAPGHAVSARIDEIGKSAHGAAAGGKVVHIRAGRSLVVQLGRGPGAGHRSAFAVVITPLAGSGPLYAGRVEANSGTGGTVQSILPVTSALLTVPLPSVHSVFLTNQP